MPSGDSRRPIPVAVGQGVVEGTPARQTTVHVLMRVTGVVIARSLHVIHQRQQEHQHRLH